MIKCVASTENGGKGGRKVKGNRLRSGVKANVKSLKPCRCR